MRICLKRFSGVITDADCEILNEYYDWSCQLPIFKLDLIGKSVLKARGVSIYKLIRFLE